MSFRSGLDKENSISLYKYLGHGLDVKKDSPLLSDDSYVKVSFLDLETTGLDFDRDEIIEIGIRTIAVNRENYSEFRKRR